jgi:hypothetical protein
MIDRKPPDRLSALAENPYNAVLHVSEASLAEARLPALEQTGPDC